MISDSYDKPFCVFDFLRDLQLLIIQYFKFSFGQQALDIGQIGLDRLDPFFNSLFLPDFVENLWCTLATAE